MSAETIDRDPLPEVPQVDLGVPDLDALRASGVSITRVAPASIPVVPEDTEEQTDSTWGGMDQW